MNFRLFYLISITAFTLVGCRSVQPPNLVTTDKAILKTTLSSLNLKTPGADVEKNIANDDYRFMGICGYACYPPGLQDADLKLAEKYGVNNLQGTTDYIEDDEHSKLIQIATNYAIEYNHVLLMKLKSK